MITFATDEISWLWLTSRVLSAASGGLLRVHYRLVLNSIFVSCAKWRYKVFHENSYRWCNWMIFKQKAWMRLISPFYNNNRGTTDDGTVDTVERYCVSIQRFTVHGAQDVLSFRLSRHWFDAGCVLNIENSHFSLVITLPTIFLSIIYTWEGELRSDPYDP